MLSFAILLFLVLIVVLFVLDFGTDLKPGVMTKIKTLLAHFQVSFPKTFLAHLKPCCHVHIKVLAGADGSLSFNTVSLRMAQSSIWHYIHTLRHLRSKVACS